MDAPAKPKENATQDAHQNQPSDNFEDSSGTPKGTQTPPFKLERRSITPEEEVDDDDSEHYAQATSSVVPNSRAHVISTTANEK